jgi:ketosteroid isomerase-like protein
MTMPSVAGDESEIRRIFEQWSAALQAKDVAVMMKDYAPTDSL